MQIFELGAACSATRVSQGGSLAQPQIIRAPFDLLSANDFERLSQPRRVRVVASYSRVAVGHIAMRGNVERIWCSRSPFPFVPCFCVKASALGRSCHDDANRALKRTVASNCKELLSQSAAAVAPLHPNQAHSAQAFSRSRAWVYADVASRAIE